MTGLALHSLASVNFHHMMRGKLDPKVAAYINTGTTLGIHSDSELGWILSLCCVFKSTYSEGRLLGSKKDAHCLGLHPARDLGNEKLTWQPSDMLWWNPWPVKGLVFEKEH